MSASADSSSRRLGVLIRTWGCQMNVYDSRRMLSQLASLNVEEVDDVADADVILLNTCHIREKASEKAFAEIGRVAAATRGRSRRATIGVAGCVAQAQGEELLRRAPSADFVVGPHNYHRLAELVEGARRDGRRAVALDFLAEDKFSRLSPSPPRRGDPSAFLAAQEGCDKFCAFCVVPYTRGEERSRSEDSLVEEGRRLVDGGASEIILLGQNVNAWNGRDSLDEPSTLARLLRRLSDELPSLRRLRYTTSHPLDMTSELIAAHGDLEILMPWLHLPAQSGSDRVLAAMNRRHGRDSYLRSIRELRRARPDIAVTSDFIVGFPGESEEDFGETLSLIDEVDFADAFSFVYSPRPGTPAAEREDAVEKEVASRRLSALQERIDDGRRRFDDAFVGRDVEVLLAKRGRREGQLLGRTPHFRSALIETSETDDVGDVGVGDFVRLRVSGISGRSLVGSATRIEA